MREMQATQNQYSDVSGQISDARAIRAFWREAREMRELTTRTDCTNEIEKPAGTAVAEGAEREAPRTWQHCAQNSFPRGQGVRLSEQEGPPAGDPLTQVKTVSAPQNVTRNILRHNAPQQPKLL